MLSSANRQIFFPNLNGLRFLAAMLVIVDHVEGYRADVGIYSHWHSAALPMLGQLGVTLFFVLSGFLITYLLLAEKETFGYIRFRDFYVRRALRIWPLYYMVVGLALFIFPHLPWLYYPGLTSQATQHLGGKLLFYCLMLPNVARELYAPVPYLSQVWSIGVEEQFYLLWPWVIHCGRRYLWLLAGLALAFAIAIQLPWFITSPNRSWVANTPVWDFIKHFLAALRMQSMCIGGVFAVLLYFRYQTVLRVIQAVPMQLVVWFLSVLFVWRGQQFGPFTFEVYSGLFGILILNLAEHQRSIISLKGTVITYLGKISYGLYMLHGLAVVAGFHAAQGLITDTTSLSHQTVMYGVTVALSILLAGLSYRFLEKPFLAYKKLFVKLESGPGL